MPKTISLCGTRGNTIAKIKIYRPDALEVAIVDMALAHYLEHLQNTHTSEPDYVVSPLVEDVPAGGPGQPEGPLPGLAPEAFTRPPKYHEERAVMESIDATAETEADIGNDVELFGE